MESFSEYDNPLITKFLFHPRKDDKPVKKMPGKIEFDIPVGEDITISGSFFNSGQSAVNMLYFHGNGEIISDYNDLGLIFKEKGVNFFPVDYRGYGRSGGSPTVSTMMSDSHMIYSYVRNWLKENNYHGKFVMMGRSLGSASALELSSTYNDDIDALIIESGFAYSVALLNFLGVDTDLIGIREEAGFRNADKISKVNKPALVIHAENDHIIPYSDGKVLYEKCGSEYKNFLSIKKANHNNIFQYGLNEYFSAIGELINYIIQY